ncbi:MAG: hypothetical protein WD623_06125 [Marinobacter sp.]|uniref:hypothetical protein n=1 Tax=Marinobacter sp. TaxID=50741 RepID=UPI0034A07C02
MMARKQATPALIALLAIASPSLQAELAFGVEPLSDPELAASRGGFLMDNLEISIGLEQIVGINGDMMVINRLTIPNLNQVINDRMVEHQMDTVLEVVSANRNGRGEARVSSNMAAGSNGWMTLIQNSLDSTVIQNIHQLDIELNNLGGDYQVPAQFSDHIGQLLGR